MSAMNCAVPADKLTEIVLTARGILFQSPIVEIFLELLTVSLRHARGLARLRPVTVRIMFSNGHGRLGLRALRCFLAGSKSDFKPSFNVRLRRHRR